MMRLLPLFLLAATCFVLPPAATAREAAVWGVRPPPGASSGTNPPSFTWEPLTDAVAYTLQVSRDSGFDAVTYSADHIPWSAHCPSQLLENGDLYYWRVAPEFEGGERGVWGEVSSFTVDNNALSYPQPSLQQLLQAMPQGHPRLFTRPEQVEALRAQARGPLKDRFKRLVADAEKALKQPPDLSDPPKYPPGVVKGQGEWSQIWRGNRKRADAVGAAAANLAFVYMLTGEARYGTGARDLLLALTKWDPQGSTKYSYNDEAAMPLLYLTARAYTWAHDVFTPAERAAVVKMMRERGRQGFQHLIRSGHLWRPYQSHNNRLWHFLGEVAVAFHGEIEEAPQWLDYAMTTFYTCYPAWGGDAGGWHEGLAYWTSYIGRFQMWALAMQAAFGVKALEKPFFRNTGYYPLYVSPPGSTFGGFGDSAVQATSKLPAGVLAVMAAMTGNAHWQWYAQQNDAELPGGYLGFLYVSAGGGATASPPTDLPTSRHFEDVGLAVLNSTLLDGRKNVQIQFKSSPLGRISHGYNSNNAFTLSIGGQAALLPTGQRDVSGSAHHRDWMWQSKSDNVILVNGKGQPPQSPLATGKITQFYASPKLDVVEGDAAASYTNLDRFTRRILFFKPHIILIHDRLEARAPSTFDLLLHAPGMFEIAGNQAFWEGPMGSFRATMLLPAQAAVSQTNVMTPPPAEWSRIKLDQWHLTARAPDTQRAGEFVTVIEINGAQANARLSRPEHVELTLPDGEVEVVLTTDYFTVRGAGLDETWGVAPAITGTTAR